MRGEGTTEIRSSSQMMDNITETLNKEGGRFALVYDPKADSWVAAMEWGMEAPDSPMAAAAAYGIDSIPAIAVEKMLREASL